MKKAWRKLYSTELLYEYIMFGLPVLVWAGFLIYQTIKIADGTVLFDRSARFIGFSVVVLLLMILVAGISLYKKSMSYIRWHKGIFDSIPAPVIVTDKNAVLLHINEAARKTINLKQDAVLEEMNCRHLIGANGGVMKKNWTHKGTEYRVYGNRLCCGGKDEGYLIFLNNANEILDSCKTRTEIIDEINRLLGRLGTASDHFNNCASTLAGYTVQQAGIISELSEVIAGIASGTLNEPEALNEKMRTVNVDMRRHVESNRAQLEKVKRSVEELNAIRNTIGGVLRDIDSSP